MNLQNEIRRLRGRPAYIPNCSRDELPKFFKEMGYKVGAEIGVFKGEFTIKFCKVGLKMYAIDPWLSYCGSGRTLRSQERQDFLFGHATRLLGRYDNCTIIRKTSMDAVKDFKNGSLDFVYIDADHSFKHIAQDICEWTKKVRKGGVVSGHDYHCTVPEARNVVCHVKEVVNAYVSVFGIKNFYIFGRSKPIGKEAKNDRYLSWMFVR